MEKWTLFVKFPSGHIDSRVCEGTWEQMNTYVRTLAAVNRAKGFRYRFEKVEA